MPKFAQQVAERSETPSWSSSSIGEITTFASLIENSVGTFLDRLRNIEECQVQIEAGLRRIEAKIDGIGSTSNQSSKKEWYTPTEVAELVGKQIYTVREWCRLRRIKAQKRQTGRGEADEWEISAQEIERYKNHGLLPIPLKY